MGWPQIVLLALWFMGIGMHLARNGEPLRTSKGEPARYSFFGRLFTVTLWCWLLWVGGFFH